MQPLRDLILVTRLEGHGIEDVSAGGIILPATREKSVHTKGEYFRARVDAMGPEATRQLPELACGDEVLLHTYHGDGDKVWVGEDGGEHGLFVKPDDIICAVEG